MNTSAATDFADARILAVADQYRNVARLLHAKISGGGFVFPLFMVSAFAIELYLKDLNAKIVETPGPGQDSCWQTRKPVNRGHGLKHRRVPPILPQPPPIFPQLAGAEASQFSPLAS